MNKVNVKVIIMVMLCTLPCLAGCGGKSGGDNSKGELFDMAGLPYVQRYQTVSLTESGILYDNSDSLIHLVTIDEGEDIIMCYDPNCTHDPATSANPDPKCMAAHYYGKTQTGYYDGCIYFLVNDGAFRHKLYRAKTDGSGRELLAEGLPFTYWIGYGLIFYNDKMYYTAMVPYADERTSAISFMSRIVEFDLLDNTYRFLTEETADTIMEMDLTENYMYMRVSDVDDGGRIFYQRVNINTCEEEIIITKDVNRDEYCYIKACSDDRYFYYDRKTCDIGIRSVDGEYREVILEGADGEFFSGWEKPSGNYMLYQRTIPYEGEAVGYYFMNLVTGEKVNITEEVEKYGIMFYDAVYDVFISRVYNESAMKIVWSMWSREKILTEAAE